MNKNTINKTVLFCIVCVLLSSCVAKKKFIEMTNSRDRAQQRVKELTDNVTTLETDFSLYKQEFHYNNATKDQYIDSLNQVVNNLGIDINTKEGNIEDELFSFQVEKNRLNNLLIQKDREIRTLTIKTVQLGSDIDDLKQQLRDAKLNQQNTASSVNSLTRKLESKENELTKLNGKIEFIRQANIKLQETIIEKDKEIEKLSNNVKLLKSQIGQN